MKEIQLAEQDAALSLPAIIRNETVLSRLPIHTLSKQGYERKNGDIKRRQRNIHHAKCF